MSLFLMLLLPTILVLLSGWILIWCLRGLKVGWWMTSTYLKDSRTLRVAKRRGFEPEPVPLDNERRGHPRWNRYSESYRGVGDNPFSSLADPGFGNEDVPW